MNYDTLKNITVSVGDWVEFAKPSGKLKVGLYLGEKSALEFFPPKTLPWVDIATWLNRFEWKDEGYWIMVPSKTKMPSLYVVSYDALTRKVYNPNRVIPFIPMNNFRDEFFSDYGMNDLYTSTNLPLEGETLECQMN